MKETYVNCQCIAQTETADAFCCRRLEFTNASDTITHMLETDLWVPKSVIHEDSHSTISDAARGDQIEIYVAQWFLEKQL